MFLIDQAIPSSSLISSILFHSKATPLQTMRTMTTPRIRIQICVRSFQILRGPMIQVNIENFLPLSLSPLPFRL